MDERDRDVGEDTDYSQLPLLRLYENRRRVPRVSLRLAALVTTRDSKVLNVNVRNISADGVQVRCDPQTARSIHPKATAIPPEGGAKILLRLQLPVRGKEHPFAAKCQLRYMAACSKDEIAFGIKFYKIPLASKAVLATYLIDAMRPSTEH